MWLHQPRCTPFLQTSASSPLFIFIFWGFFLAKFGEMERKMQNLVIRLNIGGGDQAKTQRAPWGTTGRAQPFSSHQRIHSSWALGGSRRNWGHWDFFLGGGVRGSQEGRPPRRVPVRARRVEQLSQKWDSGGFAPPHPPLFQALGCRGRALAVPPIPCHLSPAPLGALGAACPGLGVRGLILHLFPGGGTLGCLCPTP